MKKILLSFCMLSFGFSIALGQTAEAPTLGDGSSGSPYQIATLNNLYWITATDAVVASPNRATRWAAYYTQTADIDASSTSTWDGGAGWSPIGTNANRFAGNYNGQGHTIDGLYCYRPAVDFLGLFGACEGPGTIQNLGVTNVSITGSWRVGALTGTLVNSPATISNCYSTGNVSGSTFVGGLIGQAQNTLVSRSYSRCTVNGSSNYVGGLVGHTSFSATISNCYSIGNVTRSSGTNTYFGGFLGYNDASTINYCYSTGSVTYTAAVSPTDKALIGNVTGACTYTNNFWDTQTSLQTTTAGTATGKTTAEMKTSSTFTGWDLTGAIWKIDGSSSINAGYPFLAWQNGGGSALPVELTSFTASTNGSTLMLRWNTATETNNYGFDIERRTISGQSSVVSHKGSAVIDQQWAKLSFVPGNGTSNTPHEYSYADVNLPAGRFVYRLKQIDKDGTFKYSNEAEVSVELPTETGLGQNFPNPFNPTTVIRYQVSGVSNQLTAESRVLIAVYDLLGREVAVLVNEEKMPGMYHATWNAEGLASGIYFYTLRAGEFREMKRMILLK